MNSSPLFESIEKLYYTSDQDDKTNSVSLTSKKKFTKYFDKEYYTNELIKLIGGDRVIDMLFHLPRTYVYRRFVESIIDSEPLEVVSLFVRILDFHLPASPASPLRVSVCDNAHTVFYLCFFGPESKSMRYRLKQGLQYGVSGKVQGYQGKHEIVNPDYIFNKHEKKNFTGFTPVYSASATIKQPSLLNFTQRALELIEPETPDWLNASVLKENGWMSFSNALRKVHRPHETDTLEDIQKAKERLAFDEILSRQLTFKRIQAQTTKQKAPIFLKNESLDSLKKHLPFELTSGQNRAIADISKDLKKGIQMTRLVQGDVGCGKTIVALASMLHAHENGYQSAYLAPTEILAQQHYQTLEKLTHPLGVKIALLTSRVKGKKREELLNDLKIGKIDILIGTHALIEDSVIFNKLGLCLIDEQHRFGVDQRHKLLQKAPKGEVCHLLSMTATPIPRTLLMTSYGDLDLSIIPDKPAGRIAIKTQVLSLDKIEELTSKLKDLIEKDRRIYWVCPLIEESETDYAAAINRYTYLKKIFGDQVVLTHGKMSSQEKDNSMTLFKEGKARIMVATTVIEVGVDVPQATVMIIENAERFGLSQLHQLRGRVGRSQRESFCLLLYNPKGLTVIAQERLKAMKSTDDGFKIADLDLRLRGGGDLLGRQQSGFASYKLIDMAHTPDVFETLLDKAQEKANTYLKDDPTFKSLDVQFLFQLFKKEESVLFMKAG